jgi:hypothetical protein
MVHCPLSATVFIIGHALIRLLGLLFLWRYWPRVVYGATGSVDNVKAMKHTTSNNY